MKKIPALVLVLGMVVVFTGCNTTGLSMREKGGYNYTNLIYSLYDADRSNEMQPIMVEKPIKLAVAQIGENAPPESMLNVLAEKKYLISKTVVIPAAGENEELGQRMKKMRNLARDLGTDYMFLFGGSADYGFSANWLQAFDLTLVGGYVIPSNRIKAEGRAVGALIDVRTGQVLFIVSAQAKKKDQAATFVVYERQEDVLVRLRDELVDKITANFIDKLATIE